MTGDAILQLDDRSLWDRFRDGDRQAFSEIYRRHFPALFRYGCHFTTDTGLVKDILQDFFTELFLSRQSFKTPEKPKSYLLVSVRRKLLRALDKSPRTLELSELEMPAFYLEASPERNLINRQSATLAQRYIQQTLDRLTLRQKEAVYLRFYESLSYEEIADIMHLKEVKYARTLIYRALTELKPLLAEAQTLLHSR